MDRRLKLAALAVVVVLVQACGSAPPRHEAVPAELTARAEIPGMPGVRYAAGGDLSGLVTIAVDSQRKEQEYRAAQGQTGPLPPANYLAISGGGDKGAYTAGLLNGWTAAGTRPEFKLVTGISTGALIAPFAFLGAKYDATLKEVYTNTTPEDVLERRSLIKGLFSDAMADNAPLWALTRRYVTAELLQEVAAEYAKVRLQVSAYPAAIRLDQAASERERHLYVIRNARLDPDWAQVERKTMSIGGRAISSLLHTQGIGDLYRIYATADRDGVDFNLGFIPPTFTTPHPEDFDQTYMRALYDVGYNLALQGFPWLKAPPNFDPVE